MVIATAKLLAVSAALLAVSGCATYQSRPQLVYYAVPCNTPGAFEAQLAPVTSQAAANAPLGAPSMPAETETSTAPAPTCLVATQINDRSYASGYGGYGPYYGFDGGYYSTYYGYGGYGRPFYGSVAIFGHGGGRRHGGYYGGGHGFGGGSHGGGGHGGGHSTH